MLHQSINQYQSTFIDITTVAH